MLEHLEVAVVFLSKENVLISSMLPIVHQLITKLSIMMIPAVLRSLKQSFLLPYNKDGSLTV